MSKTLTIELPDDLERQLAIQAHALNEPLERLLLQVLSAIATLIPALQDANPELRKGAAEALGAIGAETAVPSLAQLLQDENIQVRQAATDALRKIGTDTALAAIATEPSLSVEPYPATDYDPITSLIGTLHLGTTDLAENHDRYLGEALERELNPSE
jgi:predicted transcriptional regulator